MPRHATERSLLVNALKRRSARKSITPVLSPNRLSEWWWDSMAHSLKQGILGRVKGISLRFSQGASRPRSSAASLGASRPRSAAAKHSPWCGTWIRMQKGGCKPFSGAAVEDELWLLVAVQPDRDIDQAKGNRPFPSSLFAIWDLKDSQRSSAAHLPIGKPDWRRRRRVSEGGVA